MRTIFWKECIWLIDQTKLPEKEEIIACRTVKELIEAIKKLAIRGAPALEAAGAYGVALASFEKEFSGIEEMKEHLINSARLIASSRPTAVNLSVGVERVLKKALSGNSIDEVREIALREAEKVAEEDVERNKRIGKIGAKLIDDGDAILTYCNTGRLATVDWGTALGIVRSAVEEGKRVKVFACETRPLNQGSRLTCYELMKDGIDVTLITDAAVGILMRKRLVKKVFVGADRIVQDGVFNKIGTFTLAIAASYHRVPFYVAAPKSTLDLTKTEKDVVIEERSREELIYCGNRLLAPKDVKVYNPAFDFTPLSLVSAIITEDGIIYPPYNF
ncbi:MAG: S-methyl-5-thioribose-1-phosphate isomerase [Archaeoglobales archaeon]|nr:S-methyl-5-thioribose-1-phosphate isomerase [Archaeoglobales archaeon]